MARPRPINYRQEMREHDLPLDRTQDWQALRGDLLDLLNQVDKQEFGHNDAGPYAHQADTRPTTNLSSREDFNAQQRDSSAPQRDRHQQALNTVAETLERFSDRGNQGVSSAIEQIRESHAGAAHRRTVHTEDYRGNLHEMSARLTALGHSLKTHDTDAINPHEITNQLAQLTHTVELLAGAVGESGQVKRLESQIAGLADVVAQAPERGQTELNRRLDRLASTVEQMSEAQYQLADRPITMIEELSSSQGRGFDAVEAGVRGIYDRIDSLEQNIGINPADIDRLSADMAELVQMVQAGMSGGSLISKIDALNARMNGIEDGNISSGGLGSDVEALRDAVRDAIEPRFFEINSKIDTLDGKLKSKSSGQSVELEDQIRQLVARMDQTGSQLSEIAQFRSDNPDAGPDFAALAELVAERTTKAVSQSTKSAIAGAGSLDERVHKSIQQVDARLARLEETLKSASAPKPAFIATKPTAPQKPTKFVKQPARVPAAHTPVAEAPQTPLPAPTSQPMNAAMTKAVDDPLQALARRADPADAMRSNPADDAPLIDPGFGQPLSEAHVESTPTPRASSNSKPVVQDALSQLASSGYDPNNADPPRRPHSSFSDDTGSTFAAVEDTAAEPSAPPETATNRNTFIEAARRAAQRQNSDIEDTNTSALSRLLTKFRPEKSAEPVEQFVDVEAAFEAPAPSGIRARLAGLGRKKHFAGDEVHPNEPSYQMDDAYHESDDDLDGQSSFIGRYKRPLMLAGLVVLVSLLALNLIQRRLSTEPNSGGQVPQSEALPVEPAGMLTQPPLDPQPTGSIDPFMRQIPSTGMPDQIIAPPLNGSGLGDSARVDALKTSAFSLAPPADELLDPPAAPATLKFELPPEVVGPVALREAAAKGDPRAQFEVAAILTEGRAVPANLEAAAKWYERAAVQGFAPAEYRLGNTYEHGQGVTKDVAQAKIWYERAAEAGNRMSMHNLAAIYASGALGKQQFPKAAEWFERAAGLGLTDSQFNLGMLHARGLGVPQDMEISYKWFSLAAARGDDGAAKARDDVARSLDAETTSRLRTEVAGWQPLELNLPANFAPIGTWSADFNPGNTIGDKNVIKEVQSALSRLGYDVGIPDGLMGPRTRDAIATFERSTGMSESGAVNPRLLAVLGSQPV